MTLEESTAKFTGRRVQFVGMFGNANGPIGQGLASHQPRRMGYTPTRPRAVAPRGHPLRLNVASRCDNHPTSSHIKRKRCEPCLPVSPPPCPITLQRSAPTPR